MYTLFRLPRGSNQTKVKALVPKGEVRLGLALFNEDKNFRMCPTHSRFGLSDLSGGEDHLLRGCTPSVSPSGAHFAAFRLPAPLLATRD